MQLNTERLQLIERFINERQHVRVAELSKYFAVSEPTIRRDLQKLEEMGRIRRAHGGASAMEQAMPEPPIDQRIVEYIEEKRSIGRAAAQLVQDGDTIFLGSGTTTLEVAPEAAAAGAAAKGSYGQGIGEELVVWVSNTC